MDKSVLYITYDGLLEPLGQSQVLAYQEILVTDYDIHILSFEKADDWNDVDKRTTLATRIKNAGIHWHPRRYHKKPSALATAYDIGIGTISALWLVLWHRISIVHARSYVPSVMALVVKRLTGAKFLFDMRGFWADERVDGGLWPRDGRMYRVAKWFEKRFLLSADHVVSLTHAAIKVIDDFPYLSEYKPPMTVITTCADLERFRPLAKPTGPFVLGYVGSVGTWYLFDEVLECFIQLKQLKTDAKLLIVNRNEHEYIKRHLTLRGISNDDVEIYSASHAEVPMLISRMHASAFFIKPVFSKISSAPTKFGELLGCGIPCLANTGVGDMAEILVSDRVGIAVSFFTPDALAVGISQLLTMCDERDIKKRCRSAAEKYFSLDSGVKKYSEIYRSLSNSDNLSV